MPANERDLAPCSERATRGYPALSCELDPSKRSKPVQLALFDNPRVKRLGGCRFKPTTTSAHGLSIAANTGMDRTRLRHQGGANRARSNGLAEDHHRTHRGLRERESRLSSQQLEDRSPRGQPTREPDVRHDRSGNPHE